jgi:hypothetical protein
MCALAARIEALRWLRQEFGDAYKPPLDGSVHEGNGDLGAEKAYGEQPARQRLPVGETPWIRMESSGSTGSRPNSRPLSSTCAAAGSRPRLSGSGRSASTTGRSASPSPTSTRTAARRLQGPHDPCPQAAALHRARRRRPRRPRYGIGYGFDLGDPNAHVFGLHRARTRTLVVCEGELNALAVSQAGVPGAVAIGTTTMTPAQRMLLRMHADELVFFYDSDAAGIHADRFGGTTTPATTGSPASPSTSLPTRACAWSTSTRATRRRSARRRPRSWSRPRSHGSREPSSLRDNFIRSRLCAAFPNNR